MQLPIDILIEDFEKGLRLIDQFDKKTLDDQGHRATGRLIDSLRSESFYQNGKIIGLQFMESYGRRVDTGLRPDQIPSLEDYQRDYPSWVRTVKPGLSETEVERFIYNIWRKHKREGMPTESSKRFSKTGKRTDWIKIGDQYVQDNIFGEFFTDRFLEALLDFSFRLLAESPVLQRV